MSKFFKLFGKFLREFFGEPFVKWTLLIVGAVVAVILIAGCSDEAIENELKQTKAPAQNVECVDYQLPGDADLQLILDHFDGTGTATVKVTASYGKRPGQGNKKFININWLPWGDWGGFDYSTVQFSFNVLDANGNIKDTGCVYPGLYSAPYSYKGSVKDGWSLEFFEYDRTVPIIIK